MPVYERQGGTNWVKIIVIGGIILLVLVGGCIAAVTIFGLNVAKQMFVTITPTTDASGNTILDSDHFTLAPSADWVVTSQSPMAMLRHTPTGADLTIMGMPSMIDAEDMHTGGTSQSVTIAGVSATQVRDETARTLQIALPSPGGQVFAFSMMNGNPFADAEAAMIALLNTIRWK